ncbi:MAG: mechanosensitive ion channel family protein [Nitrososphaerales archaeon]
MPLSSEIILTHQSSLASAPIANSFYAGLTTFFSQVAVFIPNLIAFFIILIVGYLIVRAGVTALNFGLRKSNLETHIGHTNLGQTVAKSGHSLTHIVVTVAKWVLYLIVVVYAISALGIPALTASMLGVLGWIPDLIAVIIIVFVGALAASWIGKQIENTLPRYGVGGGRIIGLVVELLIYAVVFNFALIQIRFGEGILYTITTALAWGLAAALAIGFGVAIAYSLRAVLPPMVSGSTTIASTLKEGQQISIDGIPNSGNGGRISGIVRSVGMFNTIIQEQPNGAFLVLPNNLLMDKPIRVQSGVEPKVLEDGMKDSMTEINEKYERQQGEAAPSGTFQTDNR